MVAPRVFDENVLTLTLNADEYEIHVGAFRIGKTENISVDCGKDQSVAIKFIRSADENEKLEIEEHVRILKKFKFVKIV